MARLIWGNIGERFFESGVDQGVLYPNTGNGVAWPGLISVSENPTGGTPRPFYLDGIKYLNLSSAEEFQATIESYGAPAEFGVSDGIATVHNGLYVTQQPRQSFGFSYRTRVGNDVEGAEHAYKIHIVYNALAAPSQRGHSTMSDSSDPMHLSWAISTTPPAVTGYKRTAHYIVDSRYADPDALSALEDLLYGTDSDPATLPGPDDLIAIFA